MEFMKVKVYFGEIVQRYAPHNAVTSTANIEKIIEREGFRTTTHQDLFLIM